MLNKIKNIALRVQNRFALRMAGVKMEDGDHLLEVLGTIIIAVVILIFFRQQIIDIFTKAMNTTDNQVNKLFDNIVTTPTTQVP